jgi:hypothetical protein
VANPVDGETVDLVINGDRVSTWLFATMYANTQVPATIGRFLEGNFEELQNSPHLFFPMTRFTYGLSYSIFGSEAMGYTVDDTTAPGRYAAFTDGCAMFFGPRLQAQAQEFWKVEPLDETKRAPLHSDIFLFGGVAHSPVDSGDCALGMLLQFVADPSKAPDGACVAQFTHELETE